MKTKHTGTMTRRHFGQLAALTAVAAGTPAWPGELASPPAQTFAFSHIPNGTGTALHTFRVAGETFEPLSSVPGIAPGQLLLHPTLPVLYALHDVGRWEHLPRGAVSAYRIDRRSGALTLLNTLPLSLAATHPHMAQVFLNGTALFVKTDAGIYNVLPLASNGSLHPVAAIHKTVEPVFRSVWVSEDTSTILIHINGADFSAFRFVRDGDGAHLRRVSHEGVRMQRSAPYDEETERILLYFKLEKIHPGMRGLELFKA